MGHQVGKQKVSELLHELDYSLQSLRKTSEGSSHPDRNAQFEHINRQAKAFQAKGQPVISVDTKKKELIGDFLNKGKEWQRAGEPEPVRVPRLHRSQARQGHSLCGVYDVARNEGWVNVGIDHDTAEFAVESHSSLVVSHGPLRAYPEATRTPPHGRRRQGSNGYRTFRLWKPQATEVRGRFGTAGLTIAHYPPGTSKWNKIEHRACFLISPRTGAAAPSRILRTVVNLIAVTTTTSKVRCASRPHSSTPGRYADKIKVSDDDFATVNIKPNTFHGDWNYAIRPLLSPSVQ